jgi:hypothetical protein
LGNAGLKKLAKELPARQAYACAAIGDVLAITFPDEEVSKGRPFAKTTNVFVFSNARVFSLAKRRICIDHFTGVRSGRNR